MSTRPCNLNNKKDNPSCYKHERHFAGCHRQPARVQIPFYSCAPPCVNLVPETRRRAFCDSCSIKKHPCRPCQVVRPTSYWPTLERGKWFGSLTLHVSEALRLAQSLGLGGFSSGAARLLGADRSSVSLKPDHPRYWPLQRQSIRLSVSTIYRIIFICFWVIYRCL